MKNLKILIINGANLNMTGIREKVFYGNQTLDEMEKEFIAYCSDNNMICECFQSNIEGEIINALHAARGNYDGIIMNAGAYSHYSYAIRDAVVACNVPCVEVHISNVFAREEFRHTSVIAPVCIGSVAGLGKFGYFAAIDYFKNTL